MRPWVKWVLIVAAIATGVVWWRWPPEPVVEPPYVPEVMSQSARLESLAQLGAMPGQGFPAAIPWGPLNEIAQQQRYALESTIAEQPLAFLVQCQEKYASQVKGYVCTFRKRERVGGKLLEPEKIEAHFRQAPFSVHMRWLEGGAGASAVLYVEGENDGKLLARPKLRFLPIMSKQIDGAEAKQSSRFPISRFGMAKGLDSTIASMQRAQARGALHLTYLGKEKVAELGDRECYKFLRTPYEPPEDDELNEYTLYVDCQTWLQSGSVLKNAAGELIAEYWFRDVRLNPEFNPKQFTRDSL